MLTMFCANCGVDMRYHPVLGAVHVHGSYYCYPEYEPVLDECNHPVIEYAL